ncbi:MAG: triose-phosphate isomerase [Pseudomonadota bacterium]
MIQPIIAGNWKMNKNIAEAVDFSVRLQGFFRTPSDRKVIIAPPFTALHAVAEAIRGSCILLAAQNMHEEEKGAFTGEISGDMLREAGCIFVIIGHSERRILFGEGDDRINRKMKSALKSRLAPIFCVGESLQEREEGKTETVIERQLKEGLNNLAVDDIDKTVIAYEPVWAIGTGKTASPLQAEDVHCFIREWMIRRYGPESADRLAILYGGSVTPKNIAELMAKPNINGALVGGASLDVDSFVRIINY